MSRNGDSNASKVALATLTLLGLLLASLGLATLVGIPLQLVMLVKMLRSRESRASTFALLPLTLLGVLLASPGLATFVGVPFLLSMLAIYITKGLRTSHLQKLPPIPEEEEAVPRSAAAVSNARSSVALMTTGGEMNPLDNDYFSDDDNLTRSSQVSPVTWLSAPDEEVTRGICMPSIDEACRMCDDFVKTVAIFADYDGCFDVISPSNAAGAKMDKMLTHAQQIGRLLHPRKYAQKILRDFLKEITAHADRVILFSGSNRQSHNADEFNSIQNDNGLAMVGLKKLAEENGWQFNASLLEDDGCNVKDIMNSREGSSKIKQMLAENNFKHLTGPTTVYFFDDVDKYLKFTRNNAKIPENIELKTVLFDWYGVCIDGTHDAPLVAISAP